VEVYNIKKLVQNNWRINVKSVSAFDSGSPNEIWKLDSEDSSYVLKLSRLKVDLDWFKFQRRILDMWKAAGIPVSAPIKTESNSCFTLYDDCVFQLLEFAEGDRYELNNLEMLKQVAELVAKLHGAIDINQLPIEDRSRKSSFNDLEKWLYDPISNFIDLKKYLGDYSQRTNYDVNSYINKIEESIEFLEKNFSYKQYIELPSVLTHGELHHTNILFNDSRISRLIDYDSIQFRPRIYDIARSSLFLSRKKRGDFFVNENYLSKFLEIYTQDNKLLNEEFEAISKILLYYFIPTAEYLKNMEESDQLDWYIPWTQKGIEYITNHYSKLINKTKKNFL